MGLYKVFKNEFYNVMTHHGFLYQDKAFIRIVNGEILQALTVKPIESYPIMVSVLPLYADFHSLKFDIDSKKPSWICGGQLYFNNYADLPCTTPVLSPEGEILLYAPCPYFRDDEEAAIKNLRKAAEITENFYIPQFDKIVDLNSYLEWYQTDSDEKQAVIYNNLNDNILCQKAYLDGNFDFGMKYICSRSREVEASSREKNEDRLRREYSKFFEAKDNNDLSCIPKHIEAEKEKTVELLSFKYPKLFGNKGKSKDNARRFSEDADPDTFYIDISDMNCDKKIAQLAAKRINKKTGGKIKIKFTE